MIFFEQNENEMMHLVDLKVPVASFKIDDTFMCGWSNEIRGLCLKIWKVIEEHNFTIPGLHPHFVLRDDRETIEMMSFQYKGFRIWGSGEISTDTMKVHCWGDFPYSASLEYFTGVQGTDDHKAFLASNTLVNSKLRGTKKIHLLYKSENHEIFKHDNDLGRLYEPEGNEPHYFLYKDVMSHIHTACLEILTELESMPRPVQRNIFIRPADIPLTNPLFEDQTLYGFAKGDKRDTPDHLPFGWRMIPLGGKKHRDHKYANLMNDSFVALEREFHERPEHTSYYQSGIHTSSRREFINTYEVHLKNANHVYIVDASVSEKAKSKALAEHKAKHPDWETSSDWDIRSPKFTDDEVDQIKADQAATMVHINDYRGQYDQPIVMVCRRVESDEIGKCVSSKNYDDFYKKRK